MVRERRVNKLQSDVQVLHSKKDTHTYTLTLTLKLAAAATGERHKVRLVDPSLLTSDLQLSQLQPAPRLSSRRSRGLHLSAPRAPTRSAALGLSALPNETPLRSLRPKGYRVSPPLLLTSQRVRFLRPETRAVPAPPATAAPLRAVPPANARNSSPVHGEW